MKSRRNADIGEFDEDEAVDDDVVAAAVVEKRALSSTSLNAQLVISPCFSMKPLVDSFFFDDGDDDDDNDDSELNT